MFLGKELRPHSYDSGKPLEGCKEGSGKIWTGFETQHWLFCEECLHRTWGGISKAGRRLMEVFPTGWQWLVEGDPGGGRSDPLAMDLGIEPLRFRNSLDGEWVGVSQERNAVLLFLFKMRGLRFRERRWSSRVPAGKWCRAEMWTEIPVFPDIAFFPFAKGLQLPCESTRGHLCFRCHQVAGAA